MTLHSSTVENCYVVGDQIFMLIFLLASEGVWAYSYVRLVSSQLRTAWAYSYVRREITATYSYVQPVSLQRRKARAFSYVQAMYGSEFGYYLCSKFEIEARK